MKVTAHEFDAEFSGLVQQERGITREVIEMIAFCMKRRFFAELGHRSVLGWLISAHGYPKSCAHRRIAAARLVTSVPAAIERLEAGKVNLSTLATLESAIRSEEKRTKVEVTPERREELFAKIEEMTEDQTERLVAVEFPEITQGRHEYVKAVSATETRMNLVFTDAQLAVMERAREISGHSHFDASWSELIVVMAEEYLKRHDPVVKAERSCARAEAKLAKSSGAGLSQDHVKKSSAEEPLQSSVGEEMRGVERDVELTEIEAPQRSGHGQFTRVHDRGVLAKLRNAILLRDGARCGFRDLVTGRRCEAREQLEIDHMIPRSLGGSNDPDNLRVLCKTHNLLAARTVFGVSFVELKMSERR